MKTIISLTAIAFLFLVQQSFSQNIGINGTGANAHPSALLDVDDAGTNTKGLLIPRLALTAINVSTPVTAPATSLLVYNTATASTGTNAVSPGYYYWDGTQWVRLQTTQDWSLTGNAGTNPAINYLGTSDAQGLVVKTNNTERMRVLSTGNIGIGTTAPTASLHIVATATNTGFQLQDGTQGLAKVLTSDATGKASWVDNTLSVDAVSTISGPTGIVSSAIGNNVILPKGVYYVMPYNLMTGVTYSSSYYANITIEAASGTISSKSLNRAFPFIANTNNVYTMPGFILRVTSSLATVRLKLSHGSAGTFSIPTETGAGNGTLYCEISKIN